MLIKLPTVVEIIGIGRSGCRSDFGLRFLAAMVILGRVRRYHGEWFTEKADTVPEAPGERVYAA